MAYIDVKERLAKLLSKKVNCNNLKKLNNNNNIDLNLNVIKSRIADLSPSIQRIIKNKNLYEISKPIYVGNNGFIYITCNKKRQNLLKVILLKSKKILWKNNLEFLVQN